jgi:hypothetical protein
VAVDGDVAGDREQPRPDRAALRDQRRRVPPGTQQRLLDEVLGRLAVTPGQPQRVAEQWTAVVGVQPAEHVLGDRLARSRAVVGLS